MPDESRPGAAGLPPGPRPPAGGLPPASSRSAATNRPSSRWNANTTAGRRCRDLYRGYMRALGNPNDAPTLAMVIAAAEAVVLAEIARQECLGAMTGINAELMIRLENTASRSLKRLGLAKPVPPPRKTFAEKMAEAEAARKAAETRAAADASPGTDTAAASDQRKGEAGAQDEGGSV